MRYIHNATDVKKLQTSLNLSLARTLHVYGDHTALLADTGVPPLTLIQYTHLAQLHFRLTKTPSDTLPATLFKTFNKSLALNNLQPSTLDYHIRNSLHQLHIDPLVDPLPHMATLPHKSAHRSEVKIAFITAHTRNNVVVLFATLKVQSFMLTKVRDCDLLIVVTSSTFLWMRMCVYDIA